MSNNVGEVERILNCLPSQDTDDDWVFEDAAAEGVLEVLAVVPESKDLRDSSWWKVGDQGSTGSCVGWATADSVLRWHFVRANRVGEDDMLSVRFIWMAAKETDEFVQRPTSFVDRSGTSLKAALNVARKFGIVSESILPFDTGVLYSKTAKSFYIKAAQLRIASYINQGKDLNNWRQWLATRGPILTRLDVDAAWRRASSTDGKLDVYTHPGKPAGHAVALVGYLPDGSFIVRNSWGTDWGDGGFAYASEDYATEAFTEAYGIIV
jgi:C1A family cysteine protease